MRLFIRRFLDVDGPGANTLSAPNMGLGEFDEICAVLQCRSIQLNVEPSSLLSSPSLCPSCHDSGSRFDG